LKYPREISVVGDDRIKRKPARGLIRFGNLKGHSRVSKQIGSDVENSSSFFFKALGPKRGIFFKEKFNIKVGR